MLSGTSGFEQIRKVLVKVEKTTAGQVLPQHLAHEMNLEQSGKYLIVKIAGQQQPFFSTLN